MPEPVTLSRPVIRTLCAGLAGLAISCLGNADPKVDSESHFLTICATNAECGEGECHCGFCTTRCTLGAEDQCGHCRESQALGTSCGAAEPATELCGSVCSSDADCAGGDAGFVCDNAGEVCIEGVVPNGAIFTHPLPTRAFCAGDALSIGYTSKVAADAGNAFTAQLSDANGDFSTFVNIGSLMSHQSGAIAAQIPTNTPSGTGYRVRVIASSPFTIGGDDGGTLAVGAKPFDAVGGHNPMMETSPGTVRVGQAVTWSLPRGTQLVAGTTYRWDFGSDASPPTSDEQAPVVSYGTPGRKSASLTLTSSGCSATIVSEGRGFVDVYECRIAVPRDATVITGSRSAGEDAGAYWVCPGASLTGGAGAHIFLETGAAASLTGGGGSDTVWLQTGASLDASGGGGSHVFIKAAGASITNVGNATVVECDNIVFDVADAPTPGCP
ncbi:MAG: hypothetical protein U1F43_26945 [Myxococcota bacterium]